MKDFFYNLQGGINTSRTKIALGSDVKKLYWDDASNVEILKNQGICRQKGNVLLFKLKDEEKIVGMFEYPKNSTEFVFVTESGKIYKYANTFSTPQLICSLDNTVSAVSFAYFLDGIVICTDTNGGIFFETPKSTEAKSLKLKKADGKDVCSISLCVYASRIWIGNGAVLYFSALGRFDDWESSEDAGYIEKFHCSTSKILALKEYIACLAIYKEDGVWLLNGTDPDTFAIARFADKGVFSQNAVLTYNNKQYFVNRGGVFTLEQAGDLSQISLGANIAAPIQEYFEKIDCFKLQNTILLSEETRNKIWLFLPFSGCTSINNILIYDCYCGAWLKRVIPYEISCAANVFDKVYTASAEGEVFVENTGNTFNGKAIKFNVSTPFFHLGQPSTRKIIEHMNFIFDESHENRFKFAVSKDYASSESFDIEQVDTIQPDCLVWQALDEEDYFKSLWGDDKHSFNWADPIEEAYKTEIFDSNTSVQLHISGEEIGDDFALVGIEFKEIIPDE